MGDDDDLPNYDSGSFAVKMASSVLSLEEDRDHWRRRAIRAEVELEKYQQHLSQQLRESQEHTGRMLLALMDPNNGLARAARAIERDPLKGAVQ